ncbi:MAG: cation-translocating P-type ATPase [Candidatus Micrarchaeota archaeon]
MTATSWHSLGEEEVLSKLRTRSGGLTTAEAEARLSEYGKNSIAIEKKISPLRIFINQFKNLLVLLLLLAAFVSLALSFINPEESEVIDAILIFAIVIANAVFGFMQEYKAERTIEALTKMSAPKARVVRGGKEIVIDSADVVPGDILLLHEGDKVAADARLIECFSMDADESSLTGESVPASKKAGVLPEKTVLAEMDNMVFMNTVITRGKGRAVVVRTGLTTEVGKIAKEISEAPEKVTQFQIEIEDVGKKVSLITLAALAVIIVTRLLLGTTDLVFLFITAVALGVAAIPEGLPAVVTLALSMATNRMLAQNALMRRLSTVQDLGSVDIICTDKTGTLTENTMTVVRIMLDSKSFDIGGKGLEKAGAIVPSGGGKPGDLELILRCGTLCNDSRETEPGKFAGDPTEIAVLLPAYKAGMDVEGLRSRFKRVGEVPFDSERKMMSVVVSDGRGSLVFTKGAHSAVLSKCSRILVNGKVRKLAKEDDALITAHNDSMASSALRVLAFAYKETAKSGAEKDVESDLIFIGLMGMVDPPREGVKKAIDDCRRAGIRVVMITGDNRFTAEAIGRELGFSGGAMTGDQLDALDGKGLAEAVERTSIYARTSPKHKVMLLKALQANGHVVCMTGDGVNDAAAIKNSDAGIAMGIRGTEVTKQASDIIILDDNFITIRNAVAEGRGTYDNIRKFVVYLLGANIAEVLIVFLATIASLGISHKLAVQLLWINLVTDGLPALALGVDPPSGGIMGRKPRKKGDRMLNMDTLYFLVSIGLCATAAALGVYAYALASFGEAEAQSILFTNFVILELLTVYVVRWRYGSGGFENKWLHISVAASLILQLFLIYGPLGGLFGTVPLAIEHWEDIGAGLVAYLTLLFCALKLEPLIVKEDDPTTRRL